MVPEDFKIAVQSILVTQKSGLNLKVKQIFTCNRIDVKIFNECWTYCHLHVYEM